jgi:hypothetical protein
VLVTNLACFSPLIRNPSEGQELKHYFVYLIIKNLFFYQTFLYFEIKNDVLSF